MTEKCVICEGEFYPEALDESKKCVVCAKEYPNAKNRDEALRQTVPEKEQMSTLTEMRVREIVKEVLRDTSIYVTASDTPDGPPKPEKPEKTEEQKQAAKDRMAVARAARSPKKETEKEID